MGTMTIMLRSRREGAQGGAQMNRNDDNDNDVTTYIFVICNGSYGLFELLYTLMRNKQVPDLKFLIETMQQQFNAVKVKAKNI